MEFLSISILLTPVWLVFILQYFFSPIFMTVSILVNKHVSSCKLMFNSETEELTTKRFTKSMNFPVKNLALVSLCTKQLKL